MKTITQRLARLQGELNRVKKLQELLHTCRELPELASLQGSIELKLALATAKERLKAEVGVLVEEFLSE